MKPFLLQSITAGLVALGIAAGAVAPVTAAPVMARPAAPMNVAVPDIVPVRAEWAGTKQREIWLRNRHNWRGERWRNNHEWRRYHRRDNWRWRDNHRRYYGGSGIFLGLGALGAYDYYAPRRTYRTYQGGSAHVRWCYNRYRSYRASDNTYQPYHAPRRQCRSPYRW